MGIVGTGIGAYKTFMDKIMSRTLYRPMFRRGGSTGEGITSGLRQGYTKTVNLQKIQDTLRILDTSGSCT